MRFILLDESVPVRLRDMLTDENRDVRHVSKLGFGGMTDPDLMQAASRIRTDVFVTCDQSLVMQQNVAALPFGVVVICTNHWSTIRGNHVLIGRAIDHVPPGTFVLALEGAHVTRHGRSPKLTDPAP